MSHPFFVFLTYLCSWKNSYTVFASEIPFCGLKSTPGIYETDTIIIQYSTTFHRLPALSGDPSVKLFSNFFALPRVYNKGAKQRHLPMHIYIYTFLFIYKHKEHKYICIGLYINIIHFKIIYK